MRIRYEIALIGLAIVAIYMAAKIFRLIYLNIGMEKNLCPNCGAAWIKTSSRRLLMDLPYRIFGLRPYRCTICEIRFFAFRSPSEIEAPPAGNAASRQHRPTAIRR